MKKQTVLTFFGSATELARVLKSHNVSITPTAIYQWGDIIPEKRAFVLARITKGELQYDPSLYHSPDDNKVA